MAHSPILSSTATTTLPLHNHKLLRRATVNHLYIAVYTAALATLFYHHFKSVLLSFNSQYYNNNNDNNNSSSNSSFILSLLLFIADLILGLTWACTQGFLVRPIRRHELLRNLDKTVAEEDLPAVDIFICTADPHKEPPTGTVNTALSVMAYGYPPEKVSVYVSDDGGAQETLFAFVEAAKFAGHWVPFCRDNHLVERCPEAYFASDGSCTSSSSSPQAENIKNMYESMKMKIETAVERGVVAVDDHIEDEEIRKVFAKWTTEFTRHDHPTIIQVLSDSEKDKDIAGVGLPKLIYVSRQKSRTHHHHFKAGALNTLVRVSAMMTNAPVVLTLDCDSYSNDPQTIKRAMCYFCDPSTRPTLAYVQFPQIFRGLNKADIYHGEHKRLYQINPMAMDGLQGPNYVGTGCFFLRRAFFGSPSTYLDPEMPELSPSHVVRKPVGSIEVLELAHRVSVAGYDDQTKWGSGLGFRYGSLSEDFNTGYRMHCVGWRAIFSHPERPAFLGDAPITLLDFLGQNKRWMHGLLGIFINKCSTITYGVQQLGLVMGLAYTNNPCWPLLSIPLTLYAFIPQISLLKGVSVFPKVSDPRFVLYIFLYVAANAKDLLDFLLEKGTFQRWWNAQRMWMICGVSSFLFGLAEYTLSSFGIAMAGIFNVTRKLQDDELKKRYDQGVFEFGVASPMFVPLTMAAIINLVSFIVGLIGVLRRGIGEMEGLILQIMVCGVVVVNSWPVYEGMLFRRDRGRMPTKITLVAASLVSLLCFFACAFSY